MCTHTFLRNSKPLTEFLDLLPQPSSSKSASLCGMPFCIFAQYPRGGLTTPRRLQRFSIALSLTSKEAATDVTGSVQTASSNSSGSISNFRCHETRQGLEQVARLGTCDAADLNGSAAYGAWNGHGHKLTLFHISPLENKKDSRIEAGVLSYVGVCKQGFRASSRGAKNAPLGAERG